MNVNFVDEISYPKSNKYKLAWAGLVISVSQDIAFVVSIGHSEVGVKIVENTLTGIGRTFSATKAYIATRESNPVGAVIGIATDESASYVTKKLRFPLIRSGLGVYAVYKAGEEENELNRQAISTQHDIQKFVGDFIPAIQEIRALISELPEGPEKKQYTGIIAALLKRKAEITVYRQRIKKSIKTDLGQDLDLSIDMAINSAQNQISMNSNIVNFVNNYINGEITYIEFNRELNRELFAKKGHNRFINIDNVLSQIESKIEEIKRTHLLVNKYNSTDGKVFSFPELLDRIPISYRLLSNIIIRELPSDAQNQVNVATTNQGTFVDPTLNNYHTNSQLQNNTIVQQQDDKDYLVFYQNEGLQIIKTIPHTQESISYDFPFDLVRGDNIFRVFLLDKYEPGMSLNNALTEKKYFRGK